MLLEFEIGNNKEYKIKGIGNNMIYTKKSARQLLGLYYLVLWKSYPKEENIGELALAIQHLGKLITIYYKDNPKKPIIISIPIDIVPLMTRPTTALIKKCNRHAKFTTTITK